MNHYVTGKTIKQLREKKGMTQAELAKRIQVSDKAVSKWETMRGLPDITLIEDLAKALGVSVMELLAGACITNHNVSSNMRKSNFYVCPICGNVIHTMGESVISCCGITLPVLEAEEAVNEHEIVVEQIQDEYVIKIDHSMTKEHYISFIAYMTSNECRIKKLYPEEESEAVFIRKGHGIVYAYCNQHDLFQVPV